MNISVYPLEATDKEGHPSQEIKFDNMLKTVETMFDSYEQYLKFVKWDGN